MNLISPSPDGRDTKERILDAAERLFADHGFADTSLRSITSVAGVNLAAVNYHFGSKEALIEAVFTRRLEPLNRERLDELDAVEAVAGRDGPDLERVIEAFIAPPLRLRRQDGGPVFMRLFGQAINQPRIREMFTEHFREVIQRYSTALRRALPGLTPDEVFWRMLFMVGAMAHTMAMADDMQRISAGLCDARDTEAVMRRLVVFITAGLRAEQPAAADEEA